MTEWSQKMAAKLKKRKHYSELRDAKFIEQQKLREEDGPELWQEVQNEINQEGNALCADMESNFLVAKSETPSEMTITADLEDGSHTCEVGFSPVSGKLTWKIENCSKGTVELAVGNNGKLSFFSGNVAVSPKYVATSILEALLG